MRKKLSIILIVLGLIFLSIPMINSLIIKYNSKQNRDLLDEMTMEQMEENSKREASYDYSTIQDIDITSTFTGLQDFDEKYLIGEISIPELNIRLPILKGVTNANLMAGAATMIEDQSMGMGNYPLAGHYARGQNLFGKLLDIEKGTKVRMTDKKTVYEYSIYDTIIVPETATYMLEHDRSDEHGKPIVSLMVCYYTSKNGKRFFALGELENEYPYNHNNLDKYTLELRQ